MSSPVADLRRAVGDGHVITDGAGFETDAAGHRYGRAAAVVCPADREEVRAVLEVCGAHDVAVVPQGGNTGLSGGGVPRDGEVVLSLARLRTVSDVDPISAELTAGAGVTLAAVQDAAGAAGLEFALDLGARTAATVGGLIATNAAGPVAARWGPMRAQVTGLEAVLADGAILSTLGTPPKDNAGYDWRDVVIGSEGTLAVVTAARLQLRPAPAFRGTALIGVADISSAVELVSRLRRTFGHRLEAADFLDRACLLAVCGHRRIAEPLPRPYGVYLVTGFTGDDEPWEDLADLLGDSDVTVADTASDRERLWSFRETVNEALRPLGHVHRYDVGLALAELPSFVERLPDCFLYGHLADGNLHINVVGDAAPDDEILTLVGRYGGTIDAEHGVGLTKRDHLHLTRSSAEIALMRRLKAAFDPEDRLNPGRVLPMSGQQPRRRTSG